MLPFANLSCGEPIPDNPHAVSVSFPTLRDVIGFERGEARVFDQLKLGYPRFVRHPFVVAAEKHLRKKLELPDGITALLSDKKAAAWLTDFVGKSGEVKEDGGIVAVNFAPDYETAMRVKSFLQHTGTGISSRQAEDYLVNEDVAEKPAAEKIYVGDASKFIHEELARLYGANADDVALTPFGMSAFFASFQAVNDIQKNKGKKRWLQLGWLYMDTIRVLERFSEEPLTHLDLADLSGLEKLLEEHGEEIAGIVTEVPTNPLIQTPNLPRVYELAKKHGVILVADSTLGTPVNLDLLPHADLIIESLTKFANGQADVALGATILNPQSVWHDQLKTELPQYLIQPYSRDVSRLAHSIQNYETRMQKIGANTIKLVKLLEEIPGITKLHWALNESTGENYRQLMRHDEAVTGVITLEFEDSFEEIYDRLKIAKGPSFGTEFTLAMPYIFMTHYDLASTEEGQAELRKHGLSPNLLRISVGLDDPAEVAAAIAEAVKK